jgi:hypothetical protein
MTTAAAAEGMHACVLLLAALHWLALQQLTMMTPTSKAPSESKIELLLTERIARSASER